MSTDEATLQSLLSAAIVRGDLEAAHLFTAALGGDLAAISRVEAAEPGQPVDASPWCDGVARSLEA